MKAVILLVLMAVVATVALTAEASSASSSLSSSKVPKGTRSLSEVEALHEDRKNKLHKKIKDIHDLNADYFDRYLKPHRHRSGRGRYWLVLFYSSWCATCDEYIAPLAEIAEVLHEKEVGEEHVVLKQKNLKRGQMSIGKHDVTKNEAVAHKYGVETYPTLVLFDRDDEKKASVYEGDIAVDPILDWANTKMQSVKLESKSRSKSKSINQEI